MFYNYYLVSGEFKNLLPKYDYLINNGYIDMGVIRSNLINPTISHQTKTDLINVSFNKINSEDAINVFGSSFKIENRWIVVPCLQTKRALQLGSDTLGNGGVFSTSIRFAAKRIDLLCLAIQLLKRVVAKSALL